MAEISQVVKNFITEFERNVVPHLNKDTNNLGLQLVTCSVSATTLLDPQLKELLGIRPGSPTGEFMGVKVYAKPDMSVETFHES